MNDRNGAWTGGEGERTFRTTGGLALEEGIDLEACHTDPVHRTALVQPHGALLVLDTPAERVRAASANVGALLDAPLPAVLGSAPGELLPPGVAAWLRRWADRSSRGPDLEVVEEGSGHRIFRVFPVGEGVGLEVERFAPDGEEPGGLVLGALPVLERLRGHDDLEALYEDCVAAVRRVAGFERVMLYRFDEEGHGTVVAEDRAPGADGYLGLRFPASDVPEPARRLYRVNPLRYIRDVEAEPVAIEGPDGALDGGALDLTHAFLRAVPEVHRRYLRNMDVRGSLSVSLRVDGELWGLIACHDSEPLRLGWPRRHALEMIGHTVAQRIERARADARADRLEVVGRFQDALGSPSTNGELFEKLTAVRGELLGLVDADAFCLRIGEERLWLDEDGRGEPPGALMERAAAALDHDTTAAVRSIRGEVDADWERDDLATGFLVARLGRSASRHCAWFRAEERETVRWGGDPRRPARVDEGGELTPRSSFEAWTQIVEGRCRVWSADDHLVVRSLTRLMDELLVEIQSEALTRVNAVLADQKDRLEEVDAERQRLLEEFRVLARTDALTGLVNRRELMRRLEAELQRARRYDGSFAVAMLDLDQFKPVNDRHGHQVGDRVLERYAELLEEELRAPDTAGRYGGEEFVLLLPRTGEEAAVRLVERLQERARELVFEADGETFTVTCSVGVTDAGEEDETVEEILERADEGLYRAKEAGRDTVRTG